VLLNIIIIFIPLACSSLFYFHAMDQFSILVKHVVYFANELIHLLIDYLKQSMLLIYLFYYFVIVVKFFIEGLQHDDVHDCVH